MQALKVCVAFVSVFFASQFTETVFHIDIAVAICLQCFDTVGWAAGMASGL